MIKIENLNKSYNNHKVLKDISLDISEGLITALLGPNGSGKTTLIKSILQLRYPDSGKISNPDGNFFDTPIGYMPQIPNFPENLKIREIIDIVSRLEKRKPEDLEYLLDEMKMESMYNKTFNELSGGMKQKVNILQCFSFRKKIYILDEPTSSLDPGMTYFFKNLLKRKKEENCSIIFTSHILSEVQQLADKLVLLVEGKLLFHGTREEALKKYNRDDLEEALRSFWEHKV
ncbi:MAG: ABC transporter ATP-binding protein [Leptospiraceae bacterium]|nr:ABC transporter ATP-binding protein [Leptospiraceae bacterium]MCP5513711.1 ABC transporter ATP-binding protein [Leptospiraceae bacterium]